MNSEKRIINGYIILMFSLLIFTNMKGYAFYKLPDTIIIGDTTAFIANTSSGWTSKSYINQDTQDIVGFELILINASSVSALTEQLIGTISNASYQPITEQSINYQLLSGNNWVVRITTTGQCYLRQVSGQSVPGNATMLPIKLRYKNK